MNVKKLFIDYFTDKGHTEIQSSSLIPKNDKSLLFVNSGMVQFKDIFLGNEKAKYSRIVTCQKCMRAGGKHNDLDNIGFTRRHHSFFEMLGNFSFGDYFKEEAIEYAWDFLTNHLNLDKSKLYISVHDSDHESRDIWLKKIGINEKKLMILGDDDNFWQMGDTGPCGPCTEIYYDLGSQLKGELPNKGDPKDRYVEIWNLVFTQYNKTKEGELENLPQKCVDTGMGLERIQSIVEHKTDNYESSIFESLKSFIDKKITITDKNSHIEKILLDHIRACCHLISDNVIPDRDGRGYVLRRIIRRSSRFLYKCDIKEPFLFSCADLVCKTSIDFPELKANLKLITETIKTEEVNYLNTLGKGIDMIDNHLKKKKSLDAEIVFTLYDTYGFPYEITEEIATEHNIKLDKQGFEKLMQKQKNRARDENSFIDKDISFLKNITATPFLGYEKNSVNSIITHIYFNDKDVKSISNIQDQFFILLNHTPFYPEGGGQVSDIGTIYSDNCQLDVLNVEKINNIIVHRVLLNSGTVTVNDKVTAKFDETFRRKIKSNHSSTHLLHHYLREILGEHVQQRGSYVSSTGFRFDFTHNRVITREEINKIELAINNEILAASPTQEKTMSYDDAINSGALAFFEEKYDDKVRVIGIGENSIELCGGTHVKNTSEIGILKIISQSSVANGIRRLECITGSSVLSYMNDRLSTLNDICKEFQTTDDKISQKIISFKNETNLIRKKYNLYSKDFLYNKYIKFKAKKIKKVICYTEFLSDLDSREIKLLADIIKSNNESSLCFLITTQSRNHHTCYISVSKNIISSYNAKSLSEKINNLFSGKGGGSDTFATCILENSNEGKLKKFLEELV